MNLIKKIWNKHYYSVCFFVFLLCYSVVIPGKCQLWQVSDLSLSFHAVDFSLGFCSKILPGAIYNMFFDDVSTFKVSVYETILLVLLFVGVSLIIEKFILHLSSKHQKTGVIISLFIVTGPITFSNYIVQLGMLDVYWIFLTALFIVFLTKKELNVLLIPVCLCAIMVHYSAAFCFVPLYFFLILYKISNTAEGKDKKRLTVIFIITVITSVILAIYFVLFETTALLYTHQEFREIMVSKGVPESYLYYYEYAFYGEGESFLGIEELTPDMTAETPVEYLVYIIKAQLANTIAIRTRQFSQGDGLNSLLIMALSIPIIIFIFKSLIELVKKNKENKIKSASLIFMMIMSVVPFGMGLLTSSDLIRWISHSFFPFFIFFAYVLYNEGEDFRESVNRRISGIPLTVLGSYLVVYAMTSFDPYGV